MQADGAESPRGATAALVGPYPFVEVGRRKLKRSHDGVVIDDHTFRRRKAEARPTPPPPPTPPTPAASSARGRFTA